MDMETNKMHLTQFGGALNKEGSEGWRSRGWRGNCWD